MRSIISSLTLAATALAASRTSAPSGCVTVAKSGAQYSTIQSAVNAKPSCIFIQPGTYNEQVYVQSSGLTIYGYTSDTGGYAGNKVTITGKRSQAGGYNNDETGTLRVHGNDFKLYNVDVVNTYGEGSQAVALSVYADAGFYGSSFVGFQDTLLTNTGTQVYVDCEVVGATDFIFGRSSLAWFERVDIRVLKHSTGYITANGADSSSNSEYVFNKCDIAAASGEFVSSGSYFLGRPWRDHARVVFQRTSMSKVINGAGWHVWNSGDERTCCVLFGEYENSGAGSSGSRAGFAKKLGSAVGVGEILGSGYKGEKWFDQAYFSG